MMFYLIYVQEHYRWKEEYVTPLIVIRGTYVLLEQLTPVLINKCSWLKARRHGNRKVHNAQASF